jgi:hypothetical protein
MSSLVVYENPVMDVLSDNQRAVVVEKSGQRLECVTEPSTNYGQSTPLTNANWSIKSPNNQVVLDRNIYATWYVEVKTDEELVLGTLDSLRSHPVSSIIESTNIKINGSGNASKRVGKIVHLEEHYDSRPDEQTRAYMTPNQIDDYIQLSNNFNKSSNPMGDFGDNPYRDTRASYTQDGAANVLVNGFYYNKFIIHESFHVSPFLNMTGYNEEGMTNINDLSINIQFSSNQSNFLTSISGVDRGNNPFPNFSGLRLYAAPELKLNWNTPLLMDSIPPVQTLSYVEADDQSVVRTGQGLLPLNTTASVKSETYSLSQVPQSVLIAIAPLDDVIQSEYGSAFFEIEKIRVVWNNQGTLLNQATQDQLYQISRRNGCNRTYQQWKKSSVLNLRFGKDIQLPDGLAPSTVGSFTFRVEVDFKNNTAIDLDGYKANFIMYYSGTAMIAQNSARFSTGLLTPAMVVSAEVASDEKDKHNNEEAMVGNGFLATSGSLTTAKRGMMPMMMPEASGEQERASRRIGGGLLRR